MPKLSTNGKPTKLETAVYTALHCYAAFQQGNDSFVFGQIPRSKDKEESGENGVSLFTALKKMKINDSNEKKALDRRVTALLATTNISSATNSINHLVSILKERKWVKRLTLLNWRKTCITFSGVRKMQDSLLEVGKRLLLERL